MKKIKILLIILFFSFFNIINVSSINIEYVGEPGVNTERSAKCGGNYCATDLQGSGIRVSLLNSEAKEIIAQVDFWPENTYNYIKNDNKNDIEEYNQQCKNLKKEVAKNKSSVTINSSDINIGLPNGINDNNAYEQYKIFVGNIKKNSNKELNTILEKLGTNLNDAIDKNQILRIEPIYIIREFLKPNHYCNDYSGTSYDIINSFGKKYDMSSGLGKSYLTGGGSENTNKGWNVVYNNKLESGLIHGNWNVIRNYVVSMYVSKPSLDGKQLSNYTAEKNNLWKWTEGNQNDLSKFTKENEDTLLWLYYSNYKNGTPNIGVGYIKISDFKEPQYTLTVNKYEYVNGQKTENYVSDAFMWVYKSPCTSVNSFLTSKTTSTGPLLFELDGNATYCVVETIKPSGYKVPQSEKSHTCEINGNTYYCKEVDLNGDQTLNFYNEKTCESEFSAAMRKGEVSMEERIRLFRKYQKDNKKLTNLLNSNKKTPSEACTYSNEKYGSPDISCFKFQYPNNEIVNNFTKENVSKYTDVILKDKKIKFCLEINKVEFEDNKNLKGIRIKSGQKVYDSLPTNSLELKCFEYDLIDDNDERRFEISTSKRYKFNDLFLYKKYRTNLNGLLQYEEEKDGSSFNYLHELDNKNSYDLLEGKETYTYKYKSLSLNFGSGVTTSQKFNKKGLYYRDLKYGIMSRLAEIGEQIIEFKVKYYDYDKGKNTDISTSNKDEGCIYNAYQKITDGSTLNLQFEQVNLNNPFIEKNSATTRRVGSNWHSKLITNESIDLNGDGVVNEIDEAIKKYASDVIYDTKASSMGDNYLVKYVMNDRPNSYSKDKPKYVITLTPSDIKTIRNYNDSNDYQDYEKVYCTDSNNVLCSTDFIDNLKTTDPKVCIGDACEKLSSGINFKREQTSTTVEKKKVNVTFQMRRFFGDIEGGTCEGNTCSLTVALNEGESIEFPKLNLNYKGEFQNWQNKSTGDIVLDSNIIVSKDSVYEANILQYKKYDVMTSIDGKKEKLCMVFGTKNIMEQCQKSLPTPTKDGYKFIGWSNPYISNSDLKITYVARFEILSQFKDFEVILNQNSFALNSKINIKDYITVNKIMQKGTNETRSRYINYSVVGFDTSNLEDNKKMTIYVSYNNMTYTYERSYNVVMLATDYLDFKDEAFKDKNAGRLKIHNSKGKIDSICVISNYKESKKQEVCATKKKDDFILDLRDLVPYTTMGSGTYSDFKLKIKATDGTELKCINPNKPEFVIKFDKLIFSSRHVCMCGTIGDAC